MIEENRVAYRIVTERLLLRPWSPEDTQRFRQAVDDNDSYLRPFIPWMKAEPGTLEQTALKLRRSRVDFDSDVSYRYGVFDHDESRLLGDVGLFTRLGLHAREVGYWIHKDFHGKGMATEAVSAAIKVAFGSSAIDRVEIQCDPLNEASARVAARLGFVHEATLRRRFRDAGDIERDCMIWTLFRDEFLETPAASMEVQAFDMLGRPLALAL